jgi:hypothetical protein
MSDEKYRPPRGNDPVDDAHGYAEELVAYIAPIEWHRDDHGEGKEPRCCKAVATATGIIREAQASALRELANRIDDTVGAELVDLLSEDREAIAAWVRARAAEIDERTSPADPHP